MTNCRSHLQYAEYGLKYVYSHSLPAHMPDLIFKPLGERYAGSVAARRADFSGLTCPIHRE